MQETEIREKVLKLIKETLDSNISIEDERNLFDEGILDSLGFIQLIVSLGETFGLDISPTTVERHELDTINKITAYVRTRISNN